MLNNLDLTIQNQCPTVVAPKYQEFAPLETIGHRFITASDGLWVEIHRPWVHIVWPVALSNGIAMPYGKLQRCIRLECGRLPADIIAKFEEDAKAASPNEIAAWVAWNEKTRLFAYLPLQAISAGTGHIHYTRPQLPEGEHLVIDLHSHGNHPAFFSQTDDKDDAGEVKFSIVVGSPSGSFGTVKKIRLCALGLKLIPAEIKEAFVYAS